MEDIEKRLRESTDACIKSFENWVKQNKNLESRETLMEAMHEVRKVVARVEIEIAISERDRLGSRPIPIPPHRSQRKGSGEEGMDQGYDDTFEMDQQPQPRQMGGGDNNRRHGGGHQGGRGRRPMHGGSREGGQRDGNRGNNNQGNGNGNNAGNASPGNAAEGSGAE